MERPSPVLVIILLFSTFHNFEKCNSEPCDKKTYQEINDPSRSTSNVWTPGTKANCDKYLVPGWYRFKNGEMPTTKVDANRCGTQVPIWIKGALPTAVKNTVRMTVCLNFFNVQNGCLQSFSIRVRNCDGFFVYELKSTFGCPYAYCAGRYNSFIYALPACGVITNPSPRYKKSVELFLFIYFFLFS